MHSSSRCLRAIIASFVVRLYLLLAFWHSFLASVLLPFGKLLIFRLGLAMYVML